ncbi:MAG: hypothetical protein AAFY59_08440 [Pseudomonadota bacterium]
MRAAVLCACLCAGGAEAQVVASRADVAGCGKPLEAGVRLAGEAVPLLARDAGPRVTIRRGLDVAAPPLGDLAAVAPSLALDFEMTYCVDLAEPQTAFDLAGSYVLQDGNGFVAEGDLASATEDAAPSAIYSATLDEKAVIVMLPGKAAWYGAFQAAYPGVPGGALYFEFEVARDE